MSERIHDRVEAYALGALESPEAREFEAHLQDCPACRNKLDAYRENLAELGRAVPPVTPPDGLRARVLAAARTSASADPADTSPTAAPGGEPEAGVTDIDEARQTPSAGDGPVGWITLIAAAIAVISLVGWWTARGDVTRLRDQVASLEATTESQAAALVERDSLLAVALGVDSRAAHLVSTDRPPSARLVWSPSRGRVILSVAQLPPAPEGRTYQLWGIPAGGSPVSLGTFDTPADGQAVVALQVPTGLDISVGAVTEEPAGGSPAPTSTPFLVGQLSRE